MSADPRGACVRHCLSKQSSVFPSCFSGSVSYRESSGTCIACVSRHPSLLLVLCLLTSSGESSGACVRHCLSKQASVFPSCFSGSVAYRESSGTCIACVSRHPSLLLVFCLLTSSGESSGTRVGHCLSKLAFFTCCLLSAHFVRGSQRCMRPALP